MSGNYQRPSSSTRITSSFNDHRNRTPPSTQPGTDYGVDKGSACYAPSAGKVTEVRTGVGPTTDGQGRYVSILFDDGKEGRCLHMDRVDVSVGQRVSRGQQIGLTGASGYGSDYYYGPHVHQTLWNGKAWSTDEIDFELHVGGETSTVKGVSRMFVTKYGSSQYRLITGDRIVAISYEAAMTMKASGVPYGAIPNPDVESLQAVLVSEASSGGGGGGGTVPPMTFQGTITPVATQAAEAVAEDDNG